MCIPSVATGSKDSGYVDDKPAKHVEKVSQREFEEGDPGFVDERTSKYKPKKKETFLETLIKELAG
ncbi:MAG: hypothetical protein ABFQ64_08435 [Campylobacterota bacterium]